MTQIKTEPEMEPMNRLLRIKTISDEAHSLKTERNPGKSPDQNNKIPLWRNEFYKNF